MDWEKLLSKIRARQLLGGKASVRSEQDDRTELERDYDRAVFSTPVRRLQDKAQVFPLEPVDSVRTRLTHSLEVSSIARDIGYQIGAWLVEKKEIDSSRVRDVTAIAATCGLVHDIGNPPFGHAGEIAMREWFSSDQTRRNHIFEPFRTADAEGCSSVFARDFLAFDGNAQTVRLLTKLQVLADEFGLNLCCGTLSAGMKYLATSDEICKVPHQVSKLGILQSEHELMQRVREEAGLEGTARHPITYLVEAADDAAYSVVDLEDGIKKDVIEWTELASALKDQIGDEFTTIQKSVRAQLGRDEPDRWVDSSAFAQAFRTAALGVIVPAIRKTFTDGNVYESIRSGDYGLELLNDDRCCAKPLVKACKKIGRELVYPSKDILKLELQGRRVIHDLMDVFWEGARVGGKDIKAKDYPGKAYRLISKNCRWVFQKQMDGQPNGALERYARLQLMTDYIAGMTDTFAVSLHGTLFNGLRS
jgi:dGTPase